MKLAIICITLLVVVLATMANGQQQQPDHAFALLEANSPGAYHTDSLLPAGEEGVVRNKRQFGYGGYGGGFRGGYGGYGRGFGGGYGGYGRGFGGGYGGYGGGFGYGR